MGEQIPSPYSQQAEYAQGFEHHNPMALDDLLKTEIAKDLQDQFFGVPFSRVFAMTNITPEIANRLMFQLKIAILELTMSAPPPNSIYSCSETGRKKLTSENIRTLHLLEMWFCAWVSRSIGGAERDAIKTQTRESRIVTTPMNTGGGMTRMQGWAMRMKGRGKQ